MKLILLAAIAARAAPAVAKTTADTQADATTAQGQATDATPVGGYQPAQPPMASPAPPGATVQFVPSVSPDQAFPPPPPLASYPPCKPGQTDKCKER
jgi:hypothetical protein